MIPASHKKTATARSIMLFWKEICDPYMQRLLYRISRYLLLSNPIKEKFQEEQTSHFIVWTKRQCPMLSPLPHALFQTGWLKNNL